MSRLIFIDANVPIYAAGQSHPFKEPCARILELVAERLGSVDLARHALPGRKTQALGPYSHGPGPGRQGVRALQAVGPAIASQLDPAGDEPAV